MTKEQIKENMEVGDYSLAAKMLNTSRDNVRIRFIRDKDDIKKVLTIIIENRKELIKQYHQMNN